MKLFSAAMIAAIAFSAASARERAPVRVDHFCGDRYCAVAQVPVASEHSGADHIVAHPGGCPRTAFCGCGVSVWAFGHSVRALWLAAAWRRFPRTAPASGAVAVFGRHHVAGIIQAYGDGTALVYDPNSGHHLTRIHRRSLRRATIVDPHAATRG